MIGFLFGEDLLECRKSFVKDRAMFSSFRAVTCTNTNSYCVAGALDHSVKRWVENKVSNI